MSDATQAPTEVEILSPALIAGAELDRTVCREPSALYLDGGSSYWQVTGNVVGGYVPNWLYVQHYSPTSDNNTVEDNYVGSNAGPIKGTPPSDNTIAKNTTGLTSWPTAASTIIANAGLEPA